MHIVIIGNGIAGSTAARYIRRNSFDDITMISEESDFPYSRTALMYVFMGHVRYEDTKIKEDHFWKKNRIQTLKDRVINVLPEQKNIELQSGKTLAYDKLIIASGSVSKKPDIPGIDLAGVHYLYNLQDLSSLEESCKKGVHKAVVAGGGLIGIELVEMLASRGIQVCFAIREKGFWDHVLWSEEQKLVENHIRAHGIDLRLQSEITQITGDQRVKGVQLSSVENELPVDLVAISIGVVPNISFLKNTGIETKRGIVVDSFLQTNVADIYAIGDCAEIDRPNSGRKPIEAVWYTAKKMGKTVAKNICGLQESYDPGLWYNSAKFFDIEYQAYGDVTKNEDNGFCGFYWQHESEEKCIRFFTDKNQQITGISSLGIRLRQSVSEQWITDKKNLKDVMDVLDNVFFDPEFYKKHTKDIRHSFTKTTGQEIKTERKVSFLRNLLTPKPSK